MSQTAFCELTLAAKALLLQAPAMAAGNVRRGQPRPLQPGQAAAVLVLPAVAQGQGVLTGGPRDWLTTLVVELQARAAPGQEAEDALDALLAQVYARLHRLPEFAPGVAEAVGDPRIEWDIVEADTSLATVRLAFTVQHRTQPDSLQASA